MSLAFSKSPPVFSAGSGPSAGVGKGSSQLTPYPTSTSSSMPMPMQMPMQMPMSMPMGGGTSQSYPFGYPPSQNQIPQDIYRESLQTAVLDKVRHRCNEISQLGKAQIDSLRKTEQDLLDGQKQLQSLIQDAQQEQVQAQVSRLFSSLSPSPSPSSLVQNYIGHLRSKTNQIVDATQKMSSTSLSGKDNGGVRDDALVTPAPVYKQ